VVAFSTNRRATRTSRCPDGPPTQHAGLFGEPAGRADPAISRQQSPLGSEVPEDGCDGHTGPSGCHLLGPYATGAQFPEQPTCRPHDAQLWSRVSLRRGVGARTGMTTSLVRFGHRPAPRYVTVSLLTLTPVASVPTGVVAGASKGAVRPHAYPHNGIRVSAGCRGGANDRWWQSRCVVAVSFPVSSWAEQQFPPRERPASDRGMAPWSASARAHCCEDHCRNPVTLKPAGQRRWPRSRRAASTPTPAITRCRRGSRHFRGHREIGRVHSAVERGGNGPHSIDDLHVPLPRRPREAAPSFPV